MEEKEKSKFDRLAEKIEAGETQEQQITEEIKRKYHNFKVIWDHYKVWIFWGAVAIFVLVGWIYNWIISLFK